MRVNEWSSRKWSSRKNIDGKKSKH